MDTLSVRTEKDESGRQIPPERRLCAAFAKEMTRQILPKLQHKLTPETAGLLCREICLAGSDPRNFRRYKNGICSLPFRLCRKAGDEWFAACNIIWKCGDGKEVLCPWDAPGKSLVSFGVLIEREGIMRLESYLKKQLACARIAALPFAFSCPEGMGMAEVRIRVRDKVCASLICETEQALNKLQNSEGDGGFRLLAWPMEYSRCEITAPLRMPRRPDAGMHVAEALAGLPFSIERISIRPLPARRWLALRL